MNEIDRAVDAELRDSELHRRRRLDEELIDAYDEELEMEVD
ncbi:MAG: polyphosphate kinase 2, partial [Paraburkholderia sp.]|nr:polyphosphate kinase 2 [Paraburkholderia sp.]